MFCYKEEEEEGKEDEEEEWHFLALLASLY